MQQLTSEAVTVVAQQTGSQYGGSLQHYQHTVIVASAVALQLQQ